MKRITPWFLVAPLLGSLLGGCNFLSTGARTAYVVMERAGSAETVSPFIYRSALDQTKPLLDAKHLWVTDDVRGAKWLAVFEISLGSDPAQPAALTLSRLERNPSWDPAAVSSPSPFREPPMHPSLSLAEANQQSRQYDSGR
jgi:hypothetical protein